MTSGQAWAHQLVFRWDADNRSSNTGFGPVAWSCEPEQAEQVFRAVYGKLQVAGDEVAPGLVRIGLGRAREDVLLVRRVLGHDPGGRPGTVCHALLGSNRTLDVETCLGLHGWSWSGSEMRLDDVRGRLDPVPGVTLLRASMPECEELSRSLQDVAAPLAAATAEVLRHPGSRYTFLDRTGGRFPYRMLWGLHGVFGELRAVHPLGWSFATHDTDDSEQLRFVFVPDWPASAAHDERRVRADLRRPDRDGALELATALVEHHLEWSLRGGDGRSRVAAAMAAAAGELGRLEEGDALLIAAERAVRHLDSTARPGVPRAERRPEAVPEPGPWRGEPAPRRSEPAPVPEPPAAPEPPPATARPQVRPPNSDQDLLHALRRDLSPEETARIVRQVEHRFDDWPHELRGELGRIALDKGLFNGPSPRAAGRPQGPSQTHGAAAAQTPGPPRPAAGRVPYRRRSPAEHGPATRTVLPSHRRESRPMDAQRDGTPVIVLVMVAVFVLLIAAIVLRVVL